MKTTFEYFLELSSEIKIKEENESSKPVVIDIGNQNENAQNNDNKK